MLHNISLYLSLKMKDVLTWAFTIMTTMCVAMMLNDKPKAKLTEVKSNDKKDIIKSNSLGSSYFVHVPPNQIVAKHHT